MLTALEGFSAQQQLEWDKALKSTLPQHTRIATLPTLASPGAPGPKGDGHRVSGHSS